ncbi:MAG: Grx4 family monothiol glutaredoxin [Wenzhouxiangellaceae bacterium]|nr:Grx4 family monothiol glutaredoxin [Wenzhouxiangellaceae bacterium]
MILEPATRDRIHDLVTGHKVVLFMKGTPKMPQCGFSAQTAGALDSLLEGNYASVNVLEDPEIREGIKAFGNWPTIPQLYVDGELVGGCDIIMEMFNAGELHDLFGLEAPDRTPPEIEITPRAAEKISEFLDAYPGQHLHFKVGSDWDAQFHLGPKSGTEIQSTAGDLTVLMDLASAQRARGARIDWVETVQGEGLKLDLPGAPPPVKQMSADELQGRINAGERIIVVDTRAEPDRSQKPLEIARPLDSALMAELNEADRKTPLVFVCNLGLSSQEVAEHYRKQGFTEVFNLTGGVGSILG